MHFLIGRWRISSLTEKRQSNASHPRTSFVGISSIFFAVSVIYRTTGFFTLTSLNSCIFPVRLTQGRPSSPWTKDPPSRSPISRTNFRRRRILHPPLVFLWVPRLLYLFAFFVSTVDRLSCPQVWKLVGKGGHEYLLINL